VTDGAGPARQASPFLSAHWRYLVMLNYEVPDALLAPLVPRGTELDRWQGRALVSVVGFRFLHTRVLGVPIPFHRDFDEVNLRFYVRRVLAGGGARRGVVFVREVVPRRAIAWVARVAYNEPYFALPMRSEAPDGPTDSPGTLRYAWRRRTPSGARWEHVAVMAMGEPRVPAPGSEATFITEHYWGYTPQRDGGTVEYEVRHPPWRVWAGGSPELHADVATWYGTDFEQPLRAAPRSAFVAEGSPVTVFRPRRLIDPFMGE
jgi:uncharacterized protein